MYQFVLHLSWKLEKGFQLSISFASKKHNFVITFPFFHIFLCTVVGFQNTVFMKINIEWWMDQLLSFELSEFSSSMLFIYVLGSALETFMQNVMQLFQIKYSQLHSITKVLRWQNDTWYFRWQYFLPKCKKAFTVKSPILPALFGHKPK